MDFSKTKDGLLPVVVQDVSTGRVLMLGYMNEEALEKTRSLGRVTFWSRSKKRLWTKGEGTGNFLFVREILPDCDRDTVLVKAEPAGPVCHSGSETCFGEENKSIFSLEALERIIAKRKSEPADGSYTSALFASGINRIAQKVGEEATELIIEAKDNNEERFLNEAADLLFHYLILLQTKGKRLGDVVGVLEERKK